FAKPTADRRAGLQGWIYHSELVRQRMATGDAGDPLLHIVDRGGLVRGADGGKHGVDATGDLVHFLFDEAAGGDRRGAEADAGSLERAARLERHRVLVAGDVGEIEGLLRQEHGA